MRLALSHSERCLALATRIALLLLLVGSGISVSVAFSSPQSSSQKKSTAQDYALIFGTVWSPDDRPVEGVPIKIRRATDKKAKWELVSDSNGEFAQRVPPGKMDYIIQADIKTAKGQPKPEITVQIDDNERKNVGLHLTEPAPAKK
ncbi:MAG: carboxypeptidase-like regulatory domain-containing protein [Candidatus Korobacteraceae bacterium]